MMNMWIQCTQLNFDSGKMKTLKKLEDCARLDQSKEDNNTSLIHNKRCSNVFFGLQQNNENREKKETEVQDRE